MPQRTTTLTAAAVAILAAAACFGDESRLSGGAGSLEELALLEVRAISARDTAAMHRLRVSRHEHNEILWPEFPASRLNMPVDLAWDNIDRNSIRDAQRLVEDLGGQQLEVERVACGAGTGYDTFRVHSDCLVTLRSGSRRFEARTFGSAVEMDGQFKIIGILTD